jgi:hypothetical protein
MQQLTLYLKRLMVGIRITSLVKRLLARDLFLAILNLYLVNSLKQIAKDQPNSKRKRV